MNFEEDMGSPPGFEGPLVFIQLNRKSPRLMEKHGGKYVSILQRAQQIKNCNNKEGVFLLNKKKTMLETRVQLTYLQSADPLIAYQAEAIVATASINWGESLIGNIEKMEAL